MTQTNVVGNKSDSTKQEVPHNHTIHTPINSHLNCNVIELVNYKKQL
jgi:hypothetical protein